MFSKIDKDFSSVYKTDLAGFRLAFSRAGTYTAIVLILLGTGLDRALYPENQEFFWWVRVAVSAMIFCILLIMQTDFGKAQIPFLTFTWLLLPQIMIAWMIGVTDGAASLYYAGLNLAIFASGIVLSFTVWQNFFFGAITYALYTAACAQHPESFQWHGQFGVNSLLLWFAVVISAVFTYFNERARFLLFKLKAEVAEKNLQLEETNRNLGNIKGQLLQQEKMAAIGTLSAGLLHEVNNPVNFCLMAIEVAQTNPDIENNAEVNECLADVRQGMERIRHIVSDLKTFAYRKSDVSMPHTAFFFEHALQAALRLCGYETKDVAITWDLPADTLVEGNEPDIIGVLINLLSNAVLAIRKINREKPEIHISAKWGTENPENPEHHERLHICVRDNGGGIAPENLTRVFEPFFTTREIGQGLGLGLSISYSVIKRHGSVLTAESVLGEWTQMIFDLPRPQ